MVSDRYWSMIAGARGRGRGVLFGAQASMTLWSSDLVKKAHFCYFARCFMYVSLCPHLWVTRQRQSVWICQRPSPNVPQEHYMEWYGHGEPQHLWKCFLLATSLPRWPLEAGARTHTPKVTITGERLQEGESHFSADPCWWVFVLSRDLPRTENSPYHHPASQPPPWRYFQSSTQVIQSQASSSSHAV